MQPYHRFHFKINARLLSMLDTWSVRNGCDRSYMVNLILFKLQPVIEEYEMCGYQEYQGRDTEPLDQDIFVSLQNDLFRLLRYLHFRYSTFSMASLLRKILQIYFEKACKFNVAEVMNYVARVKKRALMRSWFSTELHAHMTHFRSFKEIILTLNERYELINVTGFT